MCFHTPAHKLNASSKIALGLLVSEAEIDAAQDRAQSELAAVAKTIADANARADAFWARMNKWADGSIR
jgi:hypothetical protein